MLREVNTFNEGVVKGKCNMWSEGCTICDAESIFELCFNAEFVQPYVDLWATTVYKHGPDPHASKQNKVFDDACLQAFHMHHFKATTLCMSQEKHTVPPHAYLQHWVFHGCTTILDYDRFVSKLLQIWQSLGQNRNSIERREVFGDLQCSTKAVRGHEVFGWSGDFDSCTDQANTSDRGSFRSSVSRDDLIAPVWRFLGVRGRNSVGRESVDFNNLHSAACKIDDCNCIGPCADECNHTTQKFFRQ